MPSKPTTTDSGVDLVEEAADAVAAMVVEEKPVEDLGLVAASAAIAAVDVDATAGAVEPTEDVVAATSIAVADVVSRVDELPMVLSVIVEPMEEATPPLESAAAAAGAAAAAAPAESSEKASPATADHIIFNVGEEEAAIIDDDAAAAAPSDVNANAVAPAPIATASCPRSIHEAEEKTTMERQTRFRKFEL